MVSFLQSNNLHLKLNQVSVKSLFLLYFLLLQGSNSGGDVEEVQTPSSVGFVPRTLVADGRFPPFAEGTFLFLSPTE